MDQAYYTQAPLVQVAVSHNNILYHVAWLPLPILQHHVPHHLHLITTRFLLQTLTIPLPPNASPLLPLLSHFFTHLRPHHPPPTIAETVLIYRAALYLHSPATPTYLSNLQARLSTEPMNEIDLQHVWEEFNYVPEWIDWLDLILFNLVEFEVLDTQPTGGYVQLFIETEMERWNERGRERFVEMWEEHRENFEIRREREGRGGFARGVEWLRENVVGVLMVLGFWR